MTGGKKRLSGKSSAFSEKNPNSVDSKRDLPWDCRHHSLFFTSKIWVLFHPKGISEPLWRCKTRNTFQHTFTTVRKKAWKKLWDLQFSVLPQDQSSQSNMWLVHFFARVHGSFAAAVRGPSLVRSGTAQRLAAHPQGLKYSYSYKTAL